MDGRVLAYYVKFLGPNNAIATKKGLCIIY